MTLQNLLCFKTLAETLSYKKTAEILFISQPAVSKHIEALEKELGVVLLDSTNRRNVSLTPAGEIFYQGVCSGKSAIDKALHELRIQSAHQKLFVDCIHGIMLPESFGDVFCSHYALAQIVPEYISSEEIPSRLAQGHFVVCPQDCLPDSGVCHFEKLSARPFFWHIVANKNHPVLKESGPAELASFIRYPFFYSQDIPAPVLARYHSEFQAACHAEPLYQIAAQNHDMVISSLQGNQCFTIATSMELPYYAPNTVQIRLSAQTDYYICWDPAEDNNQFISLLPYLV